MRATSSRKQYTTVTGKSGQITKTNLGKVGKWLIATLLVILTTFTSIYPVVSFALGTFMNTRGDYTSWTTKWWDTQNSGGENGMYGQNGILYNQMIRTALGGQLLSPSCCALLAGTIGLTRRLCRREEPQIQMGELRRQYGLLALFAPFALGRRGLLRLRLAIRLME
jgi:ABC-type Fe3+ transport system permease subunit